MKKLSLAACIAVACSYAGSAAAQTAPAAASAPAAAPSLGAVLAATPGLSLTGYVATSYTHFDTAISPSTPNLRGFDVNQNAFKLNQAGVTLAYLPSSGAGASVTLLGGSDAKIIRNGELTSGTTNSQFDVLNAFAQYAVGGLTMMAGKLPTLAGAEVVNPASDNQISRSLLFWDMEPISHTGLRASYAVGDALTVTAGVNNGWNYTSTPAGTSKTLELGASGTPSKLFSYSAAYYRGQSPLFGGASNGQLQLLDLVGTLNATDALNFVANVDMLSKDGQSFGTGHANGLALYANYSFNDKFMLSARGEYLDDKDGIVSGTSANATRSNKVKEMTLALNYTPVKNLKLSAEVRQDKSDQAIFANGAKPTDKQTSLALQAAYSF